jgi:drug/metabolite transporter (DMT)-like permease
LNKRFQADLSLLLVAFIWGSVFVIQRIAATGLGTFVFNGSRFLLGAIALLPFLKERLHFDRRQMKWILLAGFFLFSASYFQQAGLHSTTAANAGFITGAYVVMIPIIQTLFLKSRLSWYIWAAVLLAMAGIFLLSTGGSLAFNPGDFLVLIGAVLWALHVITVGMAVRDVPLLPFSIGQYAVTGLLSFALGLIFEFNTIPALASLGWTVIYAGILSISVGYTLQSRAQKLAPPADTAIILSMEGVFAALFGHFWIGEQFVPLQLVGCALILAAMLLVQIKSFQLMTPNNKNGDTGVSP